ncbi:MAG: gliding motility-associated C-terminal domain-containing protein [Saprospiraceae bacterium]|nr:gliding motility-associated C-terminal domain-containing protein [Saprospiraceae bacterium]
MRILLMLLALVCATMSLHQATAASIHETLACKVYIPNVFSPNDDGINDEFKPLFDCTPSDFEMKIFNRWGKMVYQSKSADEGWTGKEKNKDLPSDLYAYYIKITFQDEGQGTTSEIFSGEVSILR